MYYLNYIILFIILWLLIGCVIVILDIKNVDEAIEEGIEKFGYTFTRVLGISEKNLIRLFYFLCFILGPILYVKSFFTKGEEE